MEEMQVCRDVLLYASHHCNGAMFYFRFRTLAQLCVELLFYACSCFLIRFFAF